MSKILIWVLVIAAVIALAWWLLGPNGNGGDSDVTDTDVTDVTDTDADTFVATSTFIITDDTDVSSQCVIETDQGTSEAYVHPGEEVTFINQGTIDRTLIFGPARKLFDPADLETGGRLIVPAGETVKIRVADDAEAAGKGNPHTFQSCHEDVGPPKIIVCPPGTSGPNC
jgi:hypothetical protein